MNPQTVSRPLIFTVRGVKFHSKLIEPVYFILISRCRIPDDCIDSNRYPLFMARAVLKELIESLQSTQGVKPC